MGELDFSGINSIGGEGDFSPIQSYVTPDLFYKLQIEEQARQLRAEYIKQQGENTINSSSIKVEILNGITEGKEVGELFLMAVECIATLTNDKGFREMCESKIKTLYPIYGNQEFSNLKKSDHENRLKALKKAYAMQSNEDEKRRIMFAIKSAEEMLKNI